MSRIMNISFFIIASMFMINLFNQINVCYMWGNTVDSLCPEAGVGHPLFIMPAAPLFGYSLSDTDGNVINPNNFTQYNATMINTVSYKQAPSGLSDIFGFFSWVITGIRFILNVFFMPIFGFPQFMTNFWLPTFITYPFGSILFILQCIGIYEFASGRPVFR